MKKLFVLISALLVIGIIVFAFIPANSHKDVSGRVNANSGNNSARANETGTQMPLAPHSAAVSPPEAQSLPSQNPLAKRFFAATDFKEFIEYAVKHPELGGYTYAVHVLSFCSYVAGLLQANEKSAASAEKSAASAADDPRVAESARSLKTKCANISKSDIASMQDLIKKGLEEQDRFIAAMGGKYSIAYSGEAPVNGPEVVRTALSGDPVLALSAGQVLLHHRLAQNVLFQGKPLAQYSRDERKEISAALDLLQCELGNPCGRESFALQAVCAYGNCGFNSVEELTKAKFMQPGSRFDWNRVIMYRDSMAQGIRSGGSPALAWASS
jgi:hypothetical protein